MPSIVRPPRFGVAFLVALATLFAPAAAFAQGPVAPGEDRIEVVGRGTVHGEPDVARIEIGVERAAAEVEVALGDANEAMNAVREALLRYGIPERDVRTEVFDVRQDTPHDRDGQVQEPTYRVIHLLAVRTTDLDDLGALLTAAVEAGADRIGAIRFELADRGALEDEARTLAMEDARGRAQRLADAAQRSLGPVRVVREGPGAGLMAEAPTAELLDARAFGSDVPIRGGTLAVEVYLEVVFGLE